MKAIVWRGGEDMRLESVADPRPAPGQVLVRIAVTAICGSDLHLPEFRAVPPVIPGHEAAGTVVECGAGVTRPSPGDRVVLDPVQRCGTCIPCSSGFDHLCENTRHLGSGTCPGTWAELVVADAANAHALPDRVGFAAASLVEPAAVCRHSLQRARVEPGAAVLVMGDGPFGFFHAQWARTLGVRKLVVAGHHEPRLRRIREATGAATCDTTRQDLEALVRDVAGPAGMDVAIEASGSGDAPGQAIPLLRPRGTLVVFSYIWSPRALDMGAIHMKELSLVGSCRSLDAFSPCIEAIAQGSLRPDLLLDARFPIVRFQEALSLLRADRDRLFKVALEPDAESARR